MSDKKGLKQIRIILVRIKRILMLAHKQSSFCMILTPSPKKSFLIFQQRIARTRNKSQKSFDRKRPRFNAELTDICSKIFFFLHPLFFKNCWGSSSKTATLFYPPAQTAFRSDKVQWFQPRSWM